MLRFPTTLNEHPRATHSRGDVPCLEGCLWKYVERAYGYPSNFFKIDSFQKSSELQPSAFVNFVAWKEGHNIKVLLDPPN